MKVRMILDISEHDRYVIAKYFAPGADSPQDRQRLRATRRQVKRFVQGALATMIKEQAQALRGHSKAAARKLASGESPNPLRETIVRPDERDQPLPL